MTRRLSNQKAAIHVFMAILLVPLISVMAFAIDSFILMTSGIQQDNNAEYTALSALKEFREGSVADRFTRAEGRAALIAGQNFYIGNPEAIQSGSSGFTDGTAGQLTFGHIDFNNSFIPAQPLLDRNNQLVLDALGQPIYNAVRVDMHTNNSNSMVVRFGNLFGASNVNLRTSVVAYVDINTGVYGFVR